MSKRPKPAPAPVPPRDRTSKPPTEIEIPPRLNLIAMRDLVSCAACGAPVGKWCWTTSGGHMSNYLHVIRKQDAVAAVSAVWARAVAAEPPDAGSLTPVDPVHVIEASLDATLLTDGPIIRAEEGWRTDETWQSRWHARLVSVVSAQDPWALLGQRPDGDVMIFDTTPAGLLRCAEWATAVRCVFPRGHHYDPEWGM